MRAPRRLRSWLRRQPRWAWWLAIGGPLGGVVLGCLAPPLFLLDSLVQGGATSDDWWIAPWAGVIAGTWGAIGGFITGVVCAFVIRALDKRGERADGRLDAAVGAVVTAVFAIPIALMNLTGTVSFSLWDVAVWLVIPVGISSAVAAITGAWIWGHTRRAEVLVA